MMITQEQITQLKEALSPVAVHEAALFTHGSKEYEAELLVTVTTLPAMVATITAAREAEIPVHVMGTGFTPGDALQIEGIVIKNNCRKFDMLSMKGVVSSGQTAREVAYVLAESGVPLNQLVRFTVEEGLAGLESFLGIPGTLGDALVANIRLEQVDQYLASQIFSLSVLTKENDVMEVEAEPFLYPLAEPMIEKKQVLPLSVVFKLVPSEKSELWKKATQAAFERNQSELLDPLKGNFNY